ncbi:MAG TPA: response regulator transcription factor [Bryobacteraceae bacterium]|jgi:DNA-binding NarL/FixJ family response regulator|nr:response regulator transcription factor [Bryobacteraceae bacterium]
MPDTAILKVAIVEDQPRIRESLQILIGRTEGFRCTGAYDSMEGALARIAGDLPNVALVDIGLPGMSGIEGIRELKKRFPEMTLVMMTIYDDDKRIFDALCAGACGYLLKKTPPARLLESLREAAGGGSPMSPEVARRVVSLFREIRPPEDAPCQLTPHEIRLLKLLVEGHNYKTAAAELNLSVNTIRFHMKSIYGKLQVHSKSEAVAKGLRQRIVR